jgi:8-amino-7-oxononanoate synthase
VRWLDDEIRALDERHLLRQPRRTAPLGATHAVVDGRTATVFCGNDYLGLRFEPAVIDAARAALAHGTGAGASRMVSGNLPEHEDLERVIANLTGAESALLASSGFAANVAALECLAGPQDIVFSDTLNHASLIDGCRLSRARVAVFPHRDATALAHTITSQRPFRRGWIVTESVFSMDGTVAPLTEYSELAKTENLHLYVDEAHAIGVLGPDGAGACAAARVRPDVLVGTLGKAFGAAGAFIAGSRNLRPFLWSRHRGHVFSTGTPPATAAAATRAIQIARSEPHLREALRANVHRLRTRLAELQLPVPSHPDVPILPIVVGDEARAVAVSAALLERGFFVQAIRPPTVPAGTARLRVTVSAAHTREQIDDFAAALAATLE